MKIRLSEVVLVIIDEISITDRRHRENSWAVNMFCLLVTTYSFLLWQDILVFKLQPTQPVDFALLAMSYIPRSISLSF
ncbi:hypothetical protein JG687_00016747 [Phytophthora cactorum]|uniref:Uncharacterized protein n=1 Tax=Phytophthora cactorum TaxID=29920 RepID=A0A8T1TR83_9STRA|nr:hypothetical protein GQ600_25205 [Phytophthora cactorum]KAG6946365.1 hypothetical protein JG687_00016747 [Phytophthora cactorum]